MRQDILETLLATSLDVDGVLAELSNEQAHLSELSAVLQARKDRAVNLPDQCRKLDYRHRIGNRREFEKTRADALFFVEIFAGNIIFGHLVSSNFLLISVPGLFDARHYVCLEGASFFDQLVDTLRIRTFEGGQSLQIPCLAARGGSTRPGADCAPDAPLLSDIWPFLRCPFLP